MNALGVVRWLVLPEAIVERLGWVLVHSLWQFALLGLVTAAVVRLMRQSSARLRHGALVVLLQTAALAPVAIWFLLARGHSYAPAPAGAIEHPSSGFAMASTDDQPSAALAPNAAAGLRAATPTAATPIAQPTAGDASWRERVSRVLQPWLPWIVTCWCVGVAACALRPLFGWRMLRRLRTIGISTPSAEILAAFDRASRRLRLRRAVGVFNSTLAIGPLLVGYVRPVVLLPVRLATSLPVAQLEALLAHELAHVHRHDFLVNVLQVLVETLFFYHPAIWRLSQRIRIEREHCCDDLVVQLYDNRADYGLALVAVEQFQGGAPSLALGATDGSLLARIRRIARVTPDRQAATLARWPNSLLGVASLGVASAAILVAVTWSAAAQGPNADRADATGDEPVVIETHQPVAATSAGPAFVLPDHRNVFALRFSPDSKSLVSVSYEQGAVAVRTWDVAAKSLTREVKVEWDQRWTRHSGSMILSQDGRKAISILEGQVGVWDAATGQLVARLDPPEDLREDHLGSLACTPDASLIACGSISKYHARAQISDAHAIVWDGTTGRVVQVLTMKHAIHVQSLALSRDGQLLAGGGLQPGTSVWDVNSGELLLSFRNANPDRKHPDPDVKDHVNDFVSSVEFSPNGKLLAISDMLGVKLIDAKSGNLVRRIDAPYRYHSSGRSFVLSADGQWLARLGTTMTLGTEDVVPIWSTETGRLAMSVATDAQDAAFSDDGKWFAVGQSDPKEAVAVWQVPARDSEPN